MMKILSLVPYNVFPARNGGQKNVVLFNKWLSLQTSLICVTVKNNDPVYAEYPVLNILSNSRLRYINVFYFFTFRRIIREQGVTHLLLEHPYYGWLGMLLKKFTGVQLVIHSVNIEASRFKSLGKWWWKLMYYYERAAHRSSDYNLFIQEADRQYAITQFGLQPERCGIATYGIEWNTVPSKEECRLLQRRIKQQYGIAEEEYILFFNGTFYYQPNIDALKTIIDVIEPLLLLKKRFRYKILICGIEIPVEISQRTYPNIIIAGFVDDIVSYVKAADVFLNPIIDGGGIKTKLVDALSYNRNSVSTVNGAIGVEPQWCNGKLLLVDNGQWQAFADAIPVAAATETDIPPAFFEHFYWENIAKKTVAFISGPLKP